MLENKCGTRENCVGSELHTEEGMCTSMLDK